ncbi:MAG: FtsW/RodA/SpoVE family cell cycle protein [Clostridia bacterium]
MKKNRLVFMINTYFKRADKILWLIMIFIAVFSLILLKSVSRATNTDYFQVQFLSLIIGLCAAFVLTIVDYSAIANYWYIIAFSAVFLMIYTIFFGINISGSGGVNATAWINIGGRTIQTSEFVKIGFIITFAKHLDILKEKGTLNKFTNVLILSIHAATPVILCHVQGDDGAGLVFFSMFIFMSFAAGIHGKYFAVLGVMLIVAVPILWNYILSDYQIERFTAVYNLDDPEVILSTGYQQYQARISIANGGLFGLGLFNGTRVATNIVTFQHSDFIFSVAGEETGFVGCSILIASLTVLMFRVLYIANNSRDYLGKVMCYGFFGLILFQSVSNIGMCLALLPVIGITLPFYSAGGSSLISLYLGLGLVECIYMKKNQEQNIKLNPRNFNYINYSKFKTEEFENI